MIDRPLSPIERMIDAACGVAPGSIPPPRRETILLRCPICKTSRTCERSEIDPPAATLQEYPCPKCGKYSAKSDPTVHEVRYFDRDGNEIPFP